MPGKDTAWIWTAMDGSDETTDGTPVMEKFAIRFKLPETAAEFAKVFNREKGGQDKLPEPTPLPKNTQNSTSAVPNSTSKPVPTFAEKKGIV